MRIAGGDLGFVSDSSAFVIAEREGNAVRVIDILEMRPTRLAPLQPTAVFDHASSFLKAHSVTAVFLDGHYILSAREGFAKHAIQVFAAPGGAEGKTMTHLAVKRLFAEGRIALPENGSVRLVAQLKDIKSRPTATGAIAIETPRKNGAHGDVASAAILAVWGALRVTGERSTRILHVGSRRQFA